VGAACLRAGFFANPREEPHEMRLPPKLAALQYALVDAIGHWTGWCVGNSAPCVGLELARENCNSLGLTSMSGEKQIFRRTQR